MRIDDLISFEFECVQMANAPWLHKQNTLLKLHSELDHGQRPPDL